MAATPRCHTDDEDDDKKVYPTRKVLFVDSYGVKSLLCFVRPTNIFIYNLARDDLKMKAIELFLNLISLLKLFSWLNNLYFGSNT
jgi:hypothetical protein